MVRTQKLKISLRYWCLARAQERPEYLAVVHALDFAERYHTGLRKDGRSPEVLHQLEIAHYLRTLLPSLAYPAQTLCAALLHDVVEDYDVPLLTIEQRFGAQVAHAVDLLSKRVEGVDKSPDLYFSRLPECPIASVVKGADRINNLQSMLGVFTLKKQRAYAAEARERFLPMLKAARRAHPEQEPAYENIRLMMFSQLEMLAAFHAKHAA